MGASYVEIRARVTHQIFVGPMMQRIVGAGRWREGGGKALGKLLLQNVLCVLHRTMH